MNKIDDSRPGGSIEPFAEYEWSRAFARLLPEDFPERLERLKEASGLSWRGLAKTFGVDPKQLRKWRKDTEPCGGAMLSIFRFASRMPGGLEIILGEGFQGFQMTFFDD